VADLVRRTPVVVLAPPHHFERRRPRECGGERSFCANPWRLFEALRQWAWDQAALTTALREVIGLSPSATIGFSLGGFQTLLLASASALDGPLVTIAATNRYAHGVLRGVVGADVLQQSKRAGIYPLALYHMTRSVQLDRYVHRLRGRDVLYIDGLYDEVDPPPSLERLRLALAPSRTLRLPAGHATLLLWRRRIAAETASFLTAVGALPADVRRARRWLRLPRPAR
jgi:pimeloyl-ACP methyl ester carboxylesterase